MKKLTIFASLIALCPSLAYAEEEAETAKAPYYIGVGAPFYNTNEILSESMITLNKGAIYGLRSLDIAETQRDWQSVGYRTARAVGLDLPISLYAAEISHELFGHGFASKNFGGSIDNITIDFPPIPYNFDYHSSTTTSGENVPADIADEWASHQKANGLQVEASMAHLVQNKFWQAGAVDYDSTILLLKTAYAPGWYNLFQSPDDDEIGDVNATNDLAALAAWYENASGEEYTADEFGERSFLVNSLNPMVLWSWYGAFKYMATGDSTTPLPYLNVFDVKWMPAMSYNLTGYGEEYALSNYFQTNGGMNGSLEFGVGSANNDFRVSAFANDILDGLGPKYEVGLELDYWEQSSARGSSGTAGFVSLDRYLFDSDTTGIHIKAGYKSFGYLRGYGLKESAILSIGLVHRL